MAFVSQYQSLDNIEITMNEGDDLLIDLVGERSWLYDKADKGYKDQIITYNAWKDISIIMNDSVENCKLRWQKLLNNYSREKLLQEKESKSGSGASKRRSWPLFERMKVLMQKNTHQFSNSYTNVPSTSENVEFPRKCYSSNKQSKSKNERTDFIKSFFNNCNATLSTINKKLEAQPSQNISINDPDELFGMLIEEELNRMDSKIAKIKRKEFMKYLCDFDSD